jgi:uncharacterized membrane protein (GlpM family)
MDILWKGLIGGMVTAAIAAAAKRGNVLPGILPLMPTFAIIALLIVGAKGDPSAFRQTCLASAKTMPAYLAFLAACYFAIGKMNAWRSVSIGFMVWLGAAIIIFLLPRWFAKG